MVIFISWSVWLCFQTVTQRASQLNVFCPNSCKTVATQFETRKPLQPTAWMTATEYVEQVFLISSK